MKGFRRCSLCSKLIRCSIVCKEIQDTIILCFSFSCFSFFLPSFCLHTLAFFKHTSTIPFLSVSRSTFLYCFFHTTPSSHSFPFPFFFLSIFTSFFTFSLITLPSMTSYPFLHSFSYSQFLSLSSLFLLLPTSPIDISYKFHRE